MWLKKGLLTEQSEEKTTTRKSKFQQLLAIIYRNKNFGVWVPKTNVEK